MVSTPTYDNLIPEIKDALGLHYRKWVAEHDGENIYAYVIYASSLVSHIGISVLTEQGLKQVASVYKTEYGYEETLEQSINDLRWSVEDTPYCLDYEEIFDSINERLSDMMTYVDSIDADDPAFDEHIDTLYSILVSALNEFRQETLGGAKRPMLYVDFGDMSEEERLRFIEQCNDQELVDWYQASIELQG